MRFTYNELKKFVDDEWKSMSEDEQHYRLVDCDPTFAEFVLSCIKENDTVEINFEDYTFEKICKNNTTASEYAGGSGFYGQY